MREMNVSTFQPQALSELQKRKLTKLFSMYDVTNTGVIKLADFELIVERLAALERWKRDGQEYLNIAAKLAHRWIHLRAEVKDSLDERSSECVTLSEWMRYHEKVLANDQYRDHIHETTNLIFDAVDVDASGGLDLREYQTLFQVYGIPVVYAEAAFDRIDVNKDGFLEKEELLPMIEEFYYSQSPEAIGNFIFGPL